MNDLATLLPETSEAFSLPPNLVGANDMQGLPELLYRLTDDFLQILPWRCRPLGRFQDLA
jgi:hypothetical protein